MLWTEPRDIWFVRVDTFWADFCWTESVSSSTGSRKRGSVARFESIASENGSVWGQSGVDQLGPPSPFIDPVPLSGWIYVPPPSNSPAAKQQGKDVPPLSVLLTAQSMVNVQMTHYQYLFLMRMVEAFGELSLFLNLDTERVIGELAAKAKELFLMLYIPRIEVSFLFPALPPQLPRDNSLASENGTHSSPSPSADFPKCSHMAVMMMQSAVSEPSLAYTAQQAQASQQPHIPPAVSSHNIVMQSPVPPPSIIVPPPTLDTKSVTPVPSKVSTPMSVSASPVNKPLPTLDMLTDNFKQGMKQGLSTVFAFSKTGGLSTPDSEVASTFSTSGSSDNIQFEHLELDGSERGGHSVEQDVEEDNVEVAMEVVEDDTENVGTTAEQVLGNGTAVSGNVSGSGIQTTIALNSVVNGPRSHEFDTVCNIKLEKGF